MGAARGSHFGARGEQKLVTRGLYGGFEAGWPSALDGLDPLLKNGCDHLTVFGRYFRRSIDQSTVACGQWPFPERCHLLTLTKPPFGYWVEATVISLLLPKELQVAVKCLRMYRAMEKGGSQFR